MSGTGTKAPFSSACDAANVSGTGTRSGGWFRLSTGQSTAVGTPSPIRHLGLPTGIRARVIHGVWRTLWTTQPVDNVGIFLRPASSPSAVDNCGQPWRTLEKRWTAGVTTVDRAERPHGRQQGHIDAPHVIHVSSTDDFRSMTCTFLELSTGSTPPTTLTRSLYQLFCPDDLPVEPRPLDPRTSSRMTTPDSGVPAHLRALMSSFPLACASWRQRARTCSASCTPHTVRSVCREVPRRA